MGVSFHVFPSVGVGRTYDTAVEQGVFNAEASMTVGAAFRGRDGFTIDGRGNFSGLSAGNLRFVIGPNLGVGLTEGTPSSRKTLFVVPEFIIPSGFTRFGAGYEASVQEGDWSNNIRFQFSTILFVLDKDTSIDLGIIVTTKPGLEDLQNVGGMLKISWI